MATATIPTADHTTTATRPFDLPDASTKWLYRILAALTIGIPLIGAAYGGWLFWQEGISLLDLGVFAVMYFATVLGVELGYHRYLSHRTIKTTPFLTTLLTILGSMAGHGPAVWWIALHRRHHQYSDHDGDPHSPRLHGEDFWGRVQGGWHSHIGWMFQPEHTAAHAAHYARDLLLDRNIQWVDRLYPVWMLLGLALPAAIGGLVTGTMHGALTGFVWGGVVRLFLGQHALWWGIVTFCHCWGPRPFRSNDDSTNSLLVAILMLGDGWHNNHHAFPNSAKVGFTWWQIDPTWWVVAGLQRVGLMWDVKVPSEQMIEAKRIRNEA